MEAWEATTACLQDQNSHLRLPKKTCCRGKAFQGKIFRAVFSSVGLSAPCICHCTNTPHYPSGEVLVAGCSEDPPTRRKSVSVPMPGNINVLQSFLLLFCAHQAAGTLSHLRISESLPCSFGSAVHRMGFILREAQPALPRDRRMPARATQAHAAQQRPPAGDPTTFHRCHELSVLGSPSQAWGLFRANSLPGWKLTKMKEWESGCKNPKGIKIRREYRWASGAAYKLVCLKICFTTTKPPY